MLPAFVNEKRKHLGLYKLQQNIPEEILQFMKWSERLKTPQKLHSGTLNSTGTCQKPHTCEISENKPENVDCVVDVLEMTIDMFFQV